MMKYKGYLGTVEYSAEDRCLYGKIAYIRDLVNYGATTVEDLEREFKIAVEDYFCLCKDQGKEPDKPFKGSFNVRIGPELHKAAALASVDQSLNSFVSEAIREKIERSS